MQKESKLLPVSPKKKSEVNSESKEEQKGGVGLSEVAAWIKVTCGVLIVFLGYLTFYLESKKTSHDFKVSDREQFSDSLVAIRSSTENLRLSPVTCTPLTAKFASMSEQRRYEIISHCTDCMLIDKRSIVGTAPELREISFHLLNCGSYEECEQTIKLARERDNTEFNEFECQILLIQLYATRLEFDKADNVYREAERKFLRGDSLSDGESMVRRLRLMRYKAMAEFVQNPKDTKPPKTLLEAIEISEGLVPLPAVYQIQEYLYALRSLYPSESTYAIEETPAQKRIETLKPSNLKQIIPKRAPAPAPSK